MKLLLLSLLMGGVTCAASTERVPIFAAKASGPGYLVIARAENPFGFEECWVNVHENNFTAAVNHPGLECRRRFGGVRSPSELTSRLNRSLAGSVRSRFTKQRLSELVYGGTFGFGLAYLDYKYLNPEFSSLKAGLFRSSNFKTSMFIVYGAFHIARALLHKPVAVPDYVPDAWLRSDVHVVDAELYETIVDALGSYR